MLSRGFGIFISYIILMSFQGRLANVAYYAGIGMGFINMVFGRISSTLFPVRPLTNVLYGSLIIILIIGIMRKFFGNAN